MDAFLESMQTRMAGLPLWAWIAALIVVGFVLTAMDDRPKVAYETGGDACGALMGGRAC